jgi:hypothetical protein
MYNWHELTRLSKADLEKVGLAERNLACAAGLPGAQRLDATLCLQQVAKLMAFVGNATSSCAFIPTHRWQAANVIEKLPDGGSHRRKIGN